MRFQVLESLRELDAQEFDRLDATCGPVGSHSRLVQLERDYRWTTEYLCAREGGVLLAAVPLYRLRKGTWPDPSYNPATWDAGLLTAPGDTTIIGGRSGLLSCLHVASAASGTRKHMRLIEELLTRESRASLLLPFLTEKELGPWKALLGSRLECYEIGADARFDGHLASEPLSRRVRQALGADLRMVERYDVESSIQTWSEVRSFAAELIARNNQANGMPDAGQLVDFRIRQWQACEGVSVVVLTARACGERGVVVCVIWRDWIDIQEIGITGTRSEVRRTLYAQLLFHLPVRLARQGDCIKHIRAGLKAEQAKAIRGASFIPLTGATFRFTHGRRQE